MEKLRQEILEALSENCRRSDTELAKLLKKPRHMVAYHHGQLLKSNLITGHKLVLNYNALGYTEYLVYLKIFQYLKIKKELVSFVEKQPNVVWAGETFPKYTLRLVIITKTPVEFENILNEFEFVCAGNVLEKQVFVRLGTIKKESYSRRLSTIKNQTNVLLSKKDKVLLFALSGDASASLLSLAKQSGFSIEGVRQKIKAWELAGLISLFTISVDAKKVNTQFWCNLLIRVNNSKKYLLKLRQLLYSDVGYGRTFNTLGAFDFEMTLFATSYDHLVELVRKLEVFFGDDFGDFELQINTRKLSAGKLPKVLLD
ncbi:hypothetical protein COV18_03425 [Candidatus Woesearchaeota archaeon CG10_big_fil_rev_8_21_14_0_10_37_12]|nr:MAG: hypothetical protein COV18_03425 [Candidatus Woesearchaeota archaeon CG10_big_fil_rev_8_21_14_0_10_37_12]